MWFSAHECRCTQISETLVLPEAGVTGGCDPSSMGAGNWAQVLCKNSMCSQPLSQILSVGGHACMPWCTSGGQRTSFGQLVLSFCFYMGFGIKLRLLGLCNKPSIHGAILPALHNISNPLKFIIYICFICMYVCMCIMCMPGAWGGQKRVSDPLWPLLHMVVSHHVGADNWTRVLCKSKCP